MALQARKRGLMVKRGGEIVEPDGSLGEDQIAKRRALAACRQTRQLSECEYYGEHGSRRRGEHIQHEKDKLAEPQGAEDIGDGHRTASALSQAEPIKQNAGGKNREQQTEEKREAAAQRLAALDNHARGNDQRRADNANAGAQQSLGVGESGFIYEEENDSDGNEEGKDPHGLEVAEALMEALVAAEASQREAEASEGEPEHAGEELPKAARVAHGDRLSTKRLLMLP